MMNLMFTFYSINITYEILRTLRLSSELFVQYNIVATFKATMHNILIQARADKRNQWWTFPYMVNQEDILAVVEKWLDEWMKYVKPKTDIPVPPVKEVGEGPSQPPHEQ